MYGLVCPSCVGSGLRYCVKGSLLSHRAALKKYWNLCVKISNSVCMESWCTYKIVTILGFSLGHICRGSGSGEYLRVYGST